MIGAAGYALLISALVAITAWLAERILSSLRWPRRFVWIAALALSIAVPVWNLAGALPDQSPFEIPVPPPAAAAAAVVKPAVASSSAAVGAALSASVPISARRGATVRGIAGAPRPLHRLWTRRLYTRLQIAFGIAWALLTVGLLARLILASRALVRRSRGWPVRVIDGVEVRVSEDLGPAVLGITRPRIVVPRWFEQELPATRAAVLEHEREHLAAHDGRWLLSGAILFALFPWNLPLMWQWRRLRFAVEVDCDARLVRRGAEPQAYGKALLEVATRTLPAPPGAPGVFGRRSRLERRLRIVLASPRRWWRFAAAPLYVLMAVSALAAVTFPAPPIDAALGARNQALQFAAMKADEIAEERRVTARLVANGNPDALAAAAVFMTYRLDTLGSPQARARAIAGGLFVPWNARERYEWLAAAAAKAPGRADLVMLEMTYCKAWNPHCDYAALGTQLRRLDPDNGAVWLDDLAVAYAHHDSAGIDAALNAIGGAKRVDSYGTRLVPVLFHALHEIGGADAQDAYSWAAQNANTMVNLQPMIAMDHLCGSRGSAQAGRTDACRRALTALEHGDNLLYLAVGSNDAARQWPADTREGRMARSTHRQLEYLERYARLRMPSLVYLALGQDAYFGRWYMPIVRAEAEHPREQDAWRALMIESGESPEPPATWKDPAL